MGRLASVRAGLLLWLDLCLRLAGCPRLAPAPVPTGDSKGFCLLCFRAGVACSHRKDVREVYVRNTDGSKLDAFTGGEISGTQRHCVILPQQSKIVGISGLERPHFKTTLFLGVLRQTWRAGFQRMNV